MLRLARARRACVVHEKAIAACSAESEGLAPRVLLAMGTALFRRTGAIGNNAEVGGHAGPIVGNVGDEVVAAAGAEIGAEHVPGTGNAGVVDGGARDNGCACCGCGFGCGCRGGCGGGQGGGTGGGYGSFDAFVGDFGGGGGYGAGCCYLDDCGLGCGEGCGYLGDGLGVFVGFDRGACV